MDVSYLLDSLNDKQREAVAAPRSNMLVLAAREAGKPACWCTVSPGY
ncbi:DNA helicase II [Salmonella enterica subsp. diarizonae]|uniref:DNA helicase II n=1 Tax=Salmonella diarizonae TaxID=59204 RepID=A0A379U621_SALDZ|nr:DNA helicase II [Salmonella enterica subsp. diarizonae]